MDKGGRLFHLTGVNDKEAAPCSCDTTIANNA
jgi:hypothetical protein